MVACNLFRPPSLVAKMAATLDVVSGGRLDFGLGAGWDESEARAYGYAFPPAGERVDRLAEAIAVIRALWTVPDATLETRHYSVRGAQCDPKPLQEPAPPVWVGGAGERRTLRVVAERADWSNFGGTPEEWAHKREVLAAHCRDIGRDPADVLGSWQHDALIRESPAEVDAAGSLDVWGADPATWRAANLVGTPEQVCARVERYVRRGCRAFVIWPADYPSHETLTLFAERVIPEFR
jgi:alkanesulfonate monooxygenase SsuD/methylene tetrahydromethanopterin reductase-like flavin-dependent oxidoreductase (luciferase family)